MTHSTALIAGASGLVGGFCLRELLEEPRYEKVISLVRKPIGIRHSKLQEVVLDFDHLKKAVGNTAVDDVFCCLGTTRKKSPSPEAYRKIDLEYVLSLAEISRKNGACQFAVVSTLGANSKSSIFYSRLKGEMEAAVSSIPFKAVHILRPSFIVGERDRQERRPLERILENILNPLSGLFIGPLRLYRPIPAKTIARAMVALARQNLTGVHVWESSQIKEQAFLTEKIRSRR